MVQLFPSHSILEEEDIICGGKKSFFSKSHKNPAENCENSEKQYYHFGKARQKTEKAPEVSKS